MVLDIGVLVKGTGRKMAYPKSYDYIPPGLYRFLVSKSGEHKLGIKEVKIMFLRDWCQRLSFKCEHPHDRIAYASGTTKP
jgi:hypothetical protein